MRDDLFTCLRIADEKFLLRCTATRDDVPVLCERPNKLNLRAGLPILFYTSTEEGLEVYLTSR